MRLSFDSKVNGCNQNLRRAIRQAVADLWIVCLCFDALSLGAAAPIKKPTYSHKSAFDRNGCE
ncbi:hypothetical protein YSA_05022 [Pseudomonas putida ND6]|uniref:Uncharacterized protein n=1 Tax=Pseudomonas putida ND6 TaxID=231023 RepID=I3UVG1_PSEPU|nr:hypothetical protein YSA_05022 [Pseudomonas putida ND6]